MSLDWLDHAACGDVPVDVFFPAPQNRGRRGADWAAVWAPARAICAACPVVDECGQDAIASGIDHGMFGGMTPDERHAAARAA